MKEYFFFANSNAAPFFSDESTGYIKGKNPEDALQKFRRRYKHPCGLFFAAIYESADAFHKRKKALVMWFSKRADMRTHGIKCGCGGQAHLVSGNTGEKGDIDEYVCEKCNKRIPINHSEYRETDK